MTIKQEALLMEGITIMPIHPLEILEYQMPEVFLCGNILCSVNEHLLEELKLGFTYEDSLFNISKLSADSQKPCEKC